jgi:hypothetical protein
VVGSIEVAAVSATLLVVAAPVAAAAAATTAAAPVAAATVAAAIGTVLPLAAANFCYSTLQLLLNDYVHIPLVCHACIAIQHEWTALCLLQNKLALLMM